MTIDEKLAMLKSILALSGDTENERLANLLLASEREILSWRYSMASVTPESVPKEYEMTQIYAVVYGFSQSGAEGQGSHSENGVSRTFAYADMLDYIHRNVPTIARVI